MFSAVLLANEAALAWREGEKDRFDIHLMPQQRIALIPHVPWQDKNIRLLARLWQIADVQFSKRHHVLSCSTEGGNGIVRFVRERIQERYSPSLKDNKHLSMS